MVAPKPDAAAPAAETMSAPGAEPEIVAKLDPEIVEAEPEPESDGATQNKSAPTEESDSETARSETDICDLFVLHRNSQRTFIIHSHNGTTMIYATQTLSLSVWERTPLRYLGFMAEVFWRVWLIILWIFYGFVRGWLGPLKRSIDKVQESAKPYVARAYQSVTASENFKPILVDVDSKVDGVMKLMDRALPESVSGICSRVYNECTKVVSRVWNEGLKSSAMSYFNQFVPVFEAYAVSMYKAAIRIPLMPEVFAIARYLAVIVNKAILAVKESGFPFAGYLPPLPVGYFDRLTKSD